MLCSACTDIFAKPRVLSYGTVYAWHQSRTSYLEALIAGCHLCSLIEEHRSKANPASRFPAQFTYCFKVLNEQWARYGQGSKWLALQHDEDIESWEYQSGVLGDPTSYGLSEMLAKDSDEVLSSCRTRPFWLVLEIYGPGEHVVLPVELNQGEPAEDLAQLNLEAQTSTGSDECLELARHWLDDCLSNHAECGTTNGERWRPTRLLYVGTAESPCLRLVRGFNVDAEEAYLALSHRSETDKDSTLTTENLSSFETDIPESRLSPTIKDALDVTRRLGSQHLWVDSLCIIQDNPKDWARESALMPKVYSNARLTVAASVADDEGCYASRNPHRVRPCRIPNPFAKDPKNLSFNIRSRHINNAHMRELKDSISESKGSPRHLIFGSNQILWTCQRHQASEAWPAGKTGEFFIDRFESFEAEKAKLRRLRKKPKDMDAAWWEFIHDYTRSKLACMSGRLVAVQGLATEVGAASNQTYCEGFWTGRRCKWPETLLWTAEDPSIPRPMDYRAPTWSWASIDGPVNSNGGRYVGSSPLTIATEVTSISSLGVCDSQGPRTTLTGLRIKATLYTVELTLSGPLPRLSVTTVDRSYRQEDDISYAETLDDRDISQEPVAGSSTEKIKPGQLASQVTLVGTECNPCFSNPPVEQVSRMRRRWSTSTNIVAEAETHRRRLRARLPDCISWFRRPICKTPVLEAKEDHTKSSKTAADEKAPIQKVHEEETSQDLGAKCHLDSLTDISAPGTVYILPLLTGSDISGLMLSPAGASLDTYERIGTFRMRENVFNTLVKAKGSGPCNLLLV
ncbi:hypothetical protein ACJ41O_014557 [Fusarium nematophilum]